MLTPEDLVPSIPVDPQDINANIISTANVECVLNMSVRLRHFPKNVKFRYYTRMKCYFICVLISFLLCSPAIGSERLELYLLSQRLMSKGTISFQDAVQFDLRSRSQGFEGFNKYQKQKNKVSVNKAIFPILSFSNNINGGNLSQTIEVGNYTFVGEKEANARSGLIVGGGLTLGAKKLYGRGKYLNFNFNSSLAAAPAHDWLKVRNETLMGCSKNHLKEWMFFDACASLAHNKRKYTDTISKSVTASFSKIFKYGRSFNEGSFIAKRDLSNSIQQMQGTIALNSLLPSGFKTKIDITSGEPVKDLISLKYSVGMTINRLLRKKPFRISFRQTLYDGGKFLGIDRADTSQQISISYPFSKGFNVAVGYTKNVSTINSFSSAGPIFSISLPAISF